MTFDELKNKALSLPLLPGVYIMKDRTGQVIYVGKAKKLKNRVSQYFQLSAAHSGKTRRMVSQITDFDTIVERSEFEALVLECSLIKRHQPRYNILLKDDKGYPYVRVDRKAEYPVMEMVGKVAADDAEYYGPFGGRYVTQQAMDAIRLALRLPGCSRVFPRDLGKGRPCLNFHIGNCQGWCQGDLSREEYLRRIDQACQLLKGDYKGVSAELERKMLQASDELRFEEAANLRDRVKAVEALGQKQLVTVGSSKQIDVVGYYENGTKACFAVLHFVEGTLVDKEHEILPPSENAQEAVSALVKQFYLKRGFAPREILLPMEMEDAELFARLLTENCGRKITIRTPQRGDGLKLVALANVNAREESERITSKEEKLTATLTALGKLLQLPEAPKRLESYDISNISGTDIVASMVVFCDGRPRKSDYRRFAVRDMEQQDDYASMAQIIRRRMARYLAGDEKFSTLPNALLIDGGAKHVACVEQVLREFRLNIPAFGMVKDARHRTRGLVTSNGDELGLTANPAHIAFIGRIQEETHRFAITYHRNLRTKRMKSSKLEQIPGVGGTRRKQLLQRFKTLRGVSQASLEELRAVVPQNVAKAVYAYFHREEEEI